MMLSIVCVTKSEPYAIPFLTTMCDLALHLGGQAVLVGDGVEAEVSLTVRYGDLSHTKIGRVNSKGFIESVLDQALMFCDGQYVLRLDDDEQCSPAMVNWLKEQLYRHAPHWKFPRAHLYGPEKLVMMHPQLWPDHQTRLSIHTMAGGRRWIHCGSPYGGGAEAPVVLEHHKFLIKSLEERRAIAQRYDSIQPGAGTGGMTAFNLPELTQWNGRLVPLGSGIAEAIR